MTDAFRLFGISPKKPSEQWVHPKKCSWSFYALVAVKSFSRTGLCVCNVRKRALRLQVHWLTLSTELSWSKINSLSTCGSITSGYSFKFILIRQKEVLSSESISQVLFHWSCKLKVWDHHHQLLLRYLNVFWIRNLLNK